MIQITIGSSSRQISNIRELDESWINQQVNRRKEDGHDVCVQVKINQEDLNIRLSTPACSRRGGGGRRPNHQEENIFNLWDKHGLNELGFSGGNVVAFFKQLRKFLN